MTISFSCVRFSVILLYLFTFFLFLNKEKQGGEPWSRTINLKGSAKAGTGLMTNVKLFKLNKKADLAEAPLKKVVKMEKNQHLAKHANKKTLPSNIKPDFAAEGEEFSEKNIDYSQEIANALEKRWAIPFFLKDKVHLEAVFKLELDSEGKIKEALLLRKTAGKEGNIYAESARKTVFEMGKFAFPLKDYKKWHTLTVRFAHQRINL